MEKYLIYNHPAVPTKGIKLGKSYSLNELQKKFSIEEIKCFFVPDNFKWEEIEVTEVKSKKEVK